MVEAEPTTNPLSNQETSLNVPQNISGIISNIIFGFNARNIKCAVGFIGFNIRHKMKFVKNCVATDAIAAPNAPNTGIRTKFPTTFRIAPERLIIHRYFCFSSASIQMLRTEPM